MSRAAEEMEPNRVKTLFQQSESLLFFTFQLETKKSSHVVNVGSIEDPREYESQFPIKDPLNKKKTHWALSFFIPRIRKGERILQSSWIFGMIN